MKQIGIVKIDTTNPVLNHYKKAICSWDKEQEFIIDGEFFFGIFLEDMFIGATKVTFNEETCTNDITIINNKNYDYLFNEDILKQITDTTLEEYNQEKNNLSYVKKLVNQNKRIFKINI